MKIKRDPSRAKPIISEYETRLKFIFEEYRTRAERILRVADTMHNSNEILLSDLKMAAQQMNGPGNRIVNEMTYKSYMHGVAYADLQLKKIGVDPSKGLGVKPGAAKKLKVGIDYSFSLPPDQQIFNILLNKSLSNLKGITDEMSKRIVQELSEGILQGEGMDKLGKRLNNAIDTIGITRAVMLARTETMSAVNQATMSRYHKAGVTQVEWIAGADNRCCDQCLGYNGKTFDMDKVPAIPVHPNCRCTTAPLPESD